MNKLPRGRMGALIAVAALAAFFTLPFEGVPLITGHSVHSFDTGVTTSSLEWHWPLALLAVLFAGGIALILSPGRPRRR